MMDIPFEQVKSDMVSVHYEICGAKRFSLSFRRHLGELLRHTRPHCWILIVSRTGLLRLMMKRISKGRLEHYLLVTFISSSASCRNWSRVTTLLSPPPLSAAEDTVRMLRKYMCLMHWYLLEKTISSLHTFLLAIVLHPQELKKAQEEMDRVVGRHRLPTIDDRPSLPYLNCLLKEVLRWVHDLNTSFSFLVSWIHGQSWNPMVPLGIPHRLMEDDIYRDFFIPKGATVLANI